jgi:hypothetical protein
MDEMKGMMMEIPMFLLLVICVLMNVSPCLREIEKLILVIDGNRVGLALLCVFLYK